MVKISDVAAEKGKQILTAEGKSEWGLRVFLAGSSCCGPSFGMDINERPSDGDNVVEKDGLKVFLDKGALEKLDGMEIHFVDDGQQQGFVIRGGKQPSEGHGSGCNSCG
jgi:iron-sulfur cluster assembly accessory protein